ncbi:hypothetical protein D5086_030096 [Populus alba]|uniref:Uncharacterized protein n=1 Tax=Populus alba TaxID=43335 RepID=A0ACC4AMK4_POPAL
MEEARVVDSSPIFNKKTRWSEKSLNKEEAKWSNHKMDTEKAPPGQTMSSWFSFHPGLQEKLFNQGTVRPIWLN